MSLIDPAANDGIAAQPLVDGDVPRRQCGRCRNFFDGDPDVDPVVRQEWWACATCRAVLLDGSSFGTKR